MAKVLASTKFETRINKRLGGAKAGNATTILMIFQFLMEALQRCRDEKADKVARRMAKAGALKQAIMARKAFREADGELTRKEARAGVLAAVAEARENPKDTAAMLTECRAEMEADQ